jgi:antitoxin component of MazEF toxin-antitoxin module
MRKRSVSEESTPVVRIPRALLDQAGLKGDLEVVAEAGCLVIQSARPTRWGWAEEARLMVERGDDGLIPGFDFPDLVSPDSVGYEAGFADGSDQESDW